MSDLSSDLNDVLYQLIREARQYSPDSLDRRRLFTRIMITMQQSGKIFKDPAITLAKNEDAFIDYEDALHKTWQFLSRNLETYDPSKANVMTWFNNHLKWRLADEKKKRLKEIKAREPWKVDELGNLLDPITNLDSQYCYNAEDVLKEVHQWLKNNQLRLTRIVIPKHPEVNCYILILEKLKDKDLQELAFFFEIKYNILRGFWKNQCLKLLQEECYPSLSIHFQNR